ncbi:uncharacterized protein LOC128877499 [Hylaeus volcanicus]|uniref:uncharacterized protein LOC128877499 n=1 Tax=Hylaeus volcanicus TaxID=313075 RepID=UPI0023B799BC|nr:uncharacterized protein LOC128877499 [Hylaeus volcanicus]
MNTWNISNSDEFVGPCSCTSEITQETTDEKVNIYSLGMNTISEHTDDTSKTVNETETQNETTVTESTTENTEGTESLADTLEKRNAKAPSYHGKFDESSEYEGQSDLEETKKETTNVSETGRNEVRMKGGASMKEDARRSIARRGTEKTSTLAEEDSTKLLDPLAGLEVFDVHKKSKRRPRRTGLETIMKREVEEKKIEENNAEEKVTKEEKAEKKKTKEKEAEDEKGTDKNAEEKRTMEKKAEKKETEEPPDVDDKTKKRSVDAQTVGSKMDKATDLPDKSKYTQTKFHKYDGKMKSENTGRDSVTPDAKGSEKDLKEEVTEGKDKSSKRKKRGEKRLKCEDEKSPRRSRWKQSSEKDRLDKATAVLCERSTDRRRETEKWNQSTDKYSPYDRRTQYPVQQYSDQFSRMGDVSWNDRFEENDFSWTCRSHPCNYQPDICSKCVSERRDDVFRHLRDSTESSIRRFEMPMVKKYLPMYQSPELIEELKKHDRMKLIREREARSRRQASSPRTPVSVSVCSKIGYQKPKRIVTCHPPGSLVDEDNRLPYQETQAYKNVLCEFRKTEHRRRPENREETEPLINLSKRADKSKKVKQLYPSPGRKRKKSDTVKKFANKIITSIRPVTCKKHKCKSHAQNLTLEEMDTSRYDYSLDPEVLSDVSPCKCSKEASTSADETTDNNDSTQ